MSSNDRINENSTRIPTVMRECKKGQELLIQKETACVSYFVQACTNLVGRKGGKSHG
jgi:hypothetical protein